MDLGIAGRRAIVCASNRGLGRGCAEALAEAGCDIVVNGLDEGRLAETARTIAEKTGAKVTPVAGDVSEHTVQQALIAAADGAPDILVNNNAGPPLRDFRELDRENMLNGVTQNMITPIELIQATIDGMMQRGFGRIVNITSTSVIMPIEGLDLSSGARAGLTAFLLGIARSVAGNGVTINNILPGKMDTDRLTANFERAVERTGKTMEEVRKAQAENVPAKRFGTADEFGRTCAFLCSVHAGYITGQNFRVDGGMVPTAF